jgi:hypothetical protein
MDAESPAEELRGSMTLGEAAAIGGTSVDYLRELLGLAADASADQRVGSLLRESGKHLSDLRRVIEDLAEPAARNAKETKP